MNLKFLSKQNSWIIAILLLVGVISTLHYNTPTQSWQYHLVYMQAYFIPIILAAFQFGVRGGLGTAILISIIYFPHIMLQWGGLIENNLMRFLQIILFNVLGYLTGLKSQGERIEKEKYQKTANDLKYSLEQLKIHSEKISEMEEQIRAADRLAIVGELTASLAHEVRNPLGSIRGAVEIIRDSVPEDIKKLEFFDILIQDTERLNHVVENYLSFSRKKTTQYSKYDITEAIKNIVLMIGAQARKSKIRIDIDLPDEEYSLIGDPNHFWQVMINVLLNAIQAMPDGGQVDVRLMPVEEGNTEHIKKICLSIKDQGKGIPKDKLQDVFKPFFTTKKKGSGLGLSITKRIADENDWKIKINSQAGVGTEFAIYIPLNKKNI